MNYYIVGCMKFFQSKTLYFFFLGYLRRFATYSIQFQTLQILMIILLIFSKYLEHILHLLCNFFHRVRYYKIILILLWSMDAVV